MEGNLLRVKGGEKNETANDNFDNNRGGSWVCGFTQGT